MRILLAYAIARDLRVRYIDIVAAFLHSDMDTDIYME